MIRLGIKSRKKRGADYIIVSCVIILTAFGLVMLSSASSNLGQAKFGDSYYYLKHQIFYGLSFGILGFFIGSRIYYRRYEKFAFAFLIISLILLGLVFTPLGFKTKGAARWLSLGPVTFQPSEIAKMAFVLYLAAWLGRRPERQVDLFKGFLPFLLVLGVLSGFFLRQPATSSAAIIILTALVVYFASGARWKYIFWLILLVALAFLVVTYFTPYRWDRIVNFIQPESDIGKGGYHLNQALNAIGSGGLWGVCYGQSIAKLKYLPEPVGDSIFAIIAEELGFVGAIALLLAFFSFIMRVFLMARKYPDKFGQLILAGFGTLLALQVAINIGSISGLIPLTGVPLPFISYGGTALAVFMTMGGIVVNISKYA